jgi:outer membrane protein assembly factor BamB
MTRRLLMLALLASLACGGSARAGGEIQVYVLLPATGQVAFVDAVAGHVVRLVPVPRGAGPIAASMQDRRVLVANTRLGRVTALDGVGGQRLWTISGLGHPVALTVVPWAPYAVVADAHGWIDVVSLARGSIVARIPVTQPRGVSLANGQLWVMGGRRDRLTQIDLSYPTRPKVVAYRRVPELRALLAGDTGVALVSEDNRLFALDSVDGARSLRVRLPGPTHQLLPGYHGAIWASVGSGQVVALRARDARIVGRMQVLPGSRLEILGGWLAAVHGHTLQMLVLGTARHGTPTTLPGAAGSFAYSVI